RRTAEGRQDSRAGTHGSPTDTLLLRNTRFPRVAMPGQARLRRTKPYLSKDASVPLEVGIVGLPKAGKTTLFNALTHAGAHVHEAKPHVGMAPIADERLEQLAPVEGSAKLTPA